MIAIKATNLSKAYQIGEFSTGTISRDIERWICKLRGKEDPFLRIGETNERDRKGSSDIVWSLKDINFEINQGEAVGIIGKNGAGKSTLLKILSRVTTPTKGNIKIKGRIASLLEVGTGFHPELTGRENIYLNGAILGMRKHEIKRKFDEIVDFSGVERYIDTPVKRYSSGMYVRLAFAVAAHLESEILIVDEVLAVGDYEFQKKCLGKMDEVSKGEGRTVLFVSHNMAAIKSFCKKGFLLSNGQMVFNGSSFDAVNKYSNFGKKFQFDNSKENNSTEKYAQLRECYVCDNSKKRKGEYDINEDIYIEMHFEINKNLDLFSSPYPQINLHNEDGKIIFQSMAVKESWEDLKAGKYSAECKIPSDFLNVGTYYVSAIFGDCNKGINTQFWEDQILSFDVTENILENLYKRNGYTGHFVGNLRPQLEWKIVPLHTKNYSANF